MRAKEYIHLYDQALEAPGGKPITAITVVFGTLVQEFSQTIKQRKSTDDYSMVSIILEVNQRWRSIVRKLNKHQTQEEYLEGGFMDYLKNTLPAFAWDVIAKDPRVHL